MIAWKPFVCGGIAYPLDHLHPCIVTFVQAAKGGKPAREYRVRLIYSLHCFTRGSKGKFAIDGSLAYSDSREIREFDFERYAWSQRLPAIVGTLPTLKCFHTTHGNFFVVREMDANGRIVNYEVYFNAVRSRWGGADLDLYVQTAYVRDAGHATARRHKPIGFFVILHNRLANRSIAPPPCP